MGIATWSDELSTGIPEADRQHRELVDILNALAGLAESNALPDEIEAALSDFRRHVVEHFAWEERYMATHNPARLSSHRTLHDILTTQLDELMAELKAEDYEGLREELATRVLPWLVEHILNVDRRMEQPIGQG